VRTQSVEITGIAAGGAGVGRLADGRVVFIHRTSPGDRLEARVLSTRKRWAKAELVRMNEPGPDRRDPPCPLYARCGGCALQHMNRDAQVRAKATIVADALRRIGGLGIDVPEVVTAANEFEYRNRVSFQLRRLHTDHVIAGFHEMDRPSTILDVDERCLLPEPAIRDSWKVLRREWGRSAHRLPAGESLRLTLQSTGSGDVGLMIHDGFGDGRPDEILERVPGIVAVWKTGPDGEPVHLAGRTALHDDDGVDLEAGVFTQVNRAVARRLEAHLRSLLGDVTGTRIIDAYCGVAGRAIRLAEAGARVTGIETNPRAVAEARRRSVPGFDIVEGPVEDELAGVLPADVIIVNPPRAGIDGTVCDTILGLSAARVIYVSCDPATLARDCARLAPRFTMNGARCFDMFPQTAHIETVADLRCVTT
jgi:23S rRNA (uracil1939-C5)-methyltransferase